MSAAAVKLPLAVKKQIKDNEAANTAELAKIEKVIGFPVTFTPNVEAMWSVLEGDSKQANIPNALASYLKSLREGFESKTNQDALTKEMFVKHWTTKTVTVSCLPKEFVGADYIKEKKNLATWNGYNGIRFVDGALDVYTKVDRFWSNVDHVYQTNFDDIFINAEEELPLKLRKEIITSQDKIKKVTERIAKATGVDAVKWDVEGEAKVNSKVADLRYPYSIAHSIEYLNGLAACLEKKCADEMVKEAVVDAFSAKTVGFKIYPSHDGLKGLEVHSSYNGIQFLDGNIFVFAQVKNFASNIDQVAYEHDIVKLF